MLALFLALDPKFKCVPFRRQNLAQDFDCLMFASKNEIDIFAGASGGVMPQFYGKAAFDCVSAETAQLRTSKKAAAETQRIARDGAMDRSLASDVTSCSSLPWLRSFFLSTITVSVPEGALARVCAQDTVASHQRDRKSTEPAEFVPEKDRQSYRDQARLRWRRVQGRRWQDLGACDRAW
jgi:hypothetical protein